MQDPVRTSGSPAPGASGSALQTFTTEHRLRLPFGSVSVAQYQWDHPTDDIWTAEAHFLDFSLTPRPRPAWARFVSGRRSEPIQLGRIMFVPAGQTVRSGAAVGRQRSLNVSLGSAAIDDLLGHSPTWDSAALCGGLQLGGAELERPLLTIRDELERPGFASDLMIETLVRALAITLVRRFDRAAPRAPHAGGLSPWRLRRIRERVRADEAPPRLQELADLCGLSVRHLTRAFRAETGRAIADYVQEATVERARTMLATSGRPVAEVARALGFASPTSFAYAFRRATGQRPRDIARATA